jgi:hypothetical protein
MSTKSLNQLLNTHFAALRSSNLPEILRRSVANWQIYAAVTGSALAMATNASASIIYSGIQNVTAGPIKSAVAASQIYQSFVPIVVRKTGGVKLGGFSFGPYQRFVSGSFLNGYARLGGSSGAAVLITNVNFNLDSEVRHRLV